MTDSASTTPSVQPETPKLPGPAAAVRTDRSFQGPLPPPDLLKGYEQACPGAAAKILDAISVEGDHRRALEKKNLDANIEAMRRQFAEARLGQIFAFSIAVSFAVVGAFLALHGQPWPGALLGSAGLGGIVTSFIAGRRGQSERNEQLELASPTHS